MDRKRPRQSHKFVRWVALAAVLGLTNFPAPHPKAAPYIAGVQPDQRPDGAPKTSGYDKSGDWQARATHGVDKPVPPAITKFLADQGAWYTPFTRPGMPGRYDIRHWHKPASGKAAK